MKKKFILIFVALIIFLLGIGSGFLTKDFFFPKEKVQDKTKVVNIYDIEPIIVPYTKIGNANVYLYNTGEVYINKQNEIINLKELWQNDKKVADSFQKIVEYLDLVKTLKDGGTEIYQTKKDNVAFSKQYTIIKCQTSDGNNDIYIGEYMDSTTAFKNGACGKNFFESKSFNRIYTITKIEELEANDTMYLLRLTIEDSNGKEVVLERSLNKETRNLLKEKQKYYFYFENKYGELIKEDIADIFEKCSLTGVVPYNA